MNGQVRFGVLGCASIAWRRMLPAFQAHPHTTVTAVASRDPDRAAHFAAEFDCAATTYGSLLDRDDVDAVYIPLPLRLRQEWVTAALQAGKHVLTEKPLASTPDQARSLAALARERRLVLRENFLFLAHPQHSEVRALVDSGRIGELRSVHSVFGIPPRPADDVRYRPELDGGALLDVGVYTLRAIQLFVPGELEVVGATLRIDPRYGVDVAGHVLLESSDGVSASAEFGFEHGYEASYTLRGSKARLRLNHAFTTPADLRPVVHVEVDQRVDGIRLDAADQVIATIGSFVDAVKNGTLGDLTESVRTVEFAAQIREAAER